MDPSRAGKPYRHKAGHDAVPPTVSAPGKQRWSIAANLRCRRNELPCREATFAPSRSRWAAVRTVVGVVPNGELTMSLRWPTLEGEPTTRPPGYRQSGFKYRRAESNWSSNALGARLLAGPTEHGAVCGRIAEPWRGPTLLDDIRAVVPLSPSIPTTAGRFRLGD